MNADTNEATVHSVGQLTPRERERKGDREKEDLARRETRQEVGFI